MSAHCHILFMSCWSLDKFCRSDTPKGFGRTWLNTFTITNRPKYTYDWWCISEFWICFTWKNMFLSPAIVSTMNERRTYPYLLARLINWYRMALDFETEISNFSASLSISFVAWSLFWSPVDLQDFVPFKWANNIFH